MTDGFKRGDRIRHTGNRRLGTVQPREGNFAVGHPQSWQEIVRWDGDAQDSLVARSLLGHADRDKDGPLAGYCFLAAE